MRIGFFSSSFVPTLPVCSQVMNTPIPVLDMENVRGMRIDCGGGIVYENHCNQLAHAQRKYRSLANFLIWLPPRAPAAAAPDEDGGNGNGPGGNGGGPGNNIVPKPAFSGASTSYATARSNVTAS